MFKRHTFIISQERLHSRVLIDFYSASKVALELNRSRILRAPEDVSCISSIDL